MNDGKYGLGLMTLYFIFLVGKSTSHVWEREAVTEGRNCTSGTSRTKVFVHFFVHVRKLQW
jgi:hypothetical protein